MKLIFVYAALSATLAFIGFSQITYADTAPDCLDDSGAVLSTMDQQVIQWKTTTQNQFKSRALVQGTVDRVFADATDHHHFEISLGPDAADTLEVVYNLGFGATPSVQVGDSVEACGDYITSYAQGGGYQPSPSGALIHWIHRSDTSKHPDGFLMVNGVLYGQGSGNN
jgi:hypothetical protein